MTGRCFIHNILVTQGDVLNTAHTAPPHDISLKQLVLQSHVRLGLETDAGAEDVGHGGALLGQRVDDGGAGGRERGLEHVAEDAEHAVEALVVGVGLGGGARGLPLDARHHLGQDDQVDDEGRGEQRVLADVEDGDGLVATHEDLGIVLVESALVVADGRHVLDDDGVVGVLAGGVEHVVGLDHVVDHVGLGDLLGAELLLRAEVLAVVVAEMVVAGNRRELDAGIDEEVDKGRFHLGLARLEVVAADEGLVLLGELDGAGDKRVLGRAVDEGRLLEDAGNSEDGRGGDLLVAGLDGLEQVLGRVVDALEEVGEALRVGSPLDNDLVQAIGGLEVAVFLLALGHRTLEGGRTGYPCGYARRAPCWPWNQGSGYQPGPPGWQQ